MHYDVDLEPLRHIQIELSNLDIMCSSNLPAIESTLEENTTHPAIPRWEMTWDMKENKKKFITISWQCFEMADRNNHYQQIPRRSKEE